MESQSATIKKRNTVKDLLIVGSLLSIILIANLFILNRQREVQTNFWEIPDEQSPYYQQMVMIIALEGNYTDSEYSVQIRDQYNQTITSATPEFQQILDGKYIHLLNFTEWATWEAGVTYRCLFIHRSWWSPLFQVNETGFYFID